MLSNQASSLDRALLSASKSCLRDSISCSVDSVGGSGCRLRWKDCQADTIKYLPSIASPAPIPKSNVSGGHIRLLPMVGTAVHLVVLEERRLLPIRLSPGTAVHLVVLEEAQES